MGEFAGRTDFWNIGYPFAGALVYLVAPITLASIDTHCVAGGVCGTT